MWVRWDVLLKGPNFNTIGYKTGRTRFDSPERGLCGFVCIVLSETGVHTGSGKTHRFSYSHGLQVEFLITS